MHLVKDTLGFLAGVSQNGTTVNTVLTSKPSRRKNALQEAPSVHSREAAVCIEAEGRGWVGLSLRTTGQDPCSRIASRESLELTAGGLTEVLIRFKQQLRVVAVGRFEENNAVGKLAWRMRQVVVGCRWQKPDWLGKVGRAH